MSAETPRAVVRSPIAPLFEEPRVSSVQISQLLAGHHVELLEERDGWWCVQGADRYEGWMHCGYLHADASNVRLESSRRSRCGVGSNTTTPGITVCVTCTGGPSSAALLRLRNASI